MRFAKYIIILQGQIELVIIFDPILNHCDIAAGHKVVSAGLFEVFGKGDDIAVGVFGESITLHMSVRKGVDERLIQKLLSPPLGF